MSQAKNALALCEWEREADERRRALSAFEHESVEAREVGQLLPESFYRQLAECRGKMRLAERRVAKAQERLAKEADRGR